MTSVSSYCCDKYCNIFEDIHYVCMYVHILELNDLSLKHVVQEEKVSLVSLIMFFALSLF